MPASSARFEGPIWEGEGRALRRRERHVEHQAFERGAVTQAADDRGAQRLRKGIAAVWLGLAAAVTHAATAEAGVVTVIEDVSGFVGAQVQALSADGAGK